jgi:H+/Cl- antiporter ClcA
MNLFSKHLTPYWDRKRQALANARALPVLSFIGLLSGILVGVIISCFRLIIEKGQASFLPGGNVENYEALTWESRLIMIVVGSFLLGLVFHFFSRSPVRVGVIHVMERLAYHEGYSPLKNAVMQFFGGAVAIIMGHSVGREGPGIHLGAAGASLLGQQLKLPNNSIRTLVACGTAASIAASFNTPLAGVIFAMEVVVLEYTISGFTPVILASVSATAVNRIVFDAEPVFNVPSLELASIWELLVVIAMGVGIGGLAALFIVSLRWVTTHTERYSIWLRFTVAGILVGVCAIAVPQIMGIGYDTINKVFLGEFTLLALILILLFKLVATAISTGMGLPAGFISPILFMGAVAGSLTGLVLTLLPYEVSAPGFYAMLGMGAMMGAALQAPLAALLALLELTANENIIFPGMLAIISANLACRELFGQKPLYISQMQGIGLDYRNDPIAQSLRRLAVSSVMNREISIVPRMIERNAAQSILSETKPAWLVIQKEEENLLLPASDLARYLEETDEDIEIDLQEIPAKRLQMSAIRQHSTLQQAYKVLNETDAEALYVIRRNDPDPTRIQGIVTTADLEASYKIRTNDSFF